MLIDYDDGRPDSEKDNAKWQNLRDSKMLDSLNSQIDEKSKVLIFIGSDHVHKRSVKSYSDGEVRPLGMRLVEQYGDEQVKSIRYVGRRTSFDGLPSFISQTPTPERISTGQAEVVILPDEGPVKGDPRVSAADFIVTVLGKE